MRDKMQSVHGSRKDSRLAMLETVYAGQLPLDLLATKNFASFNVLVRYLRGEMLGTEPVLTPEMEATMAASYPGALQSYELLEAIGVKSVSAEGDVPGVFSSSELLMWRGMPLAIVNRNNWPNRVLPQHASVVLLNAASAQEILELLWGISAKAYAPRVKALESDYSDEQVFFANPAFQDLGNGYFRLTKARNVMAPHMLFESYNPVAFLENGEIVQLSDFLGWQDGGLSEDFGTLPNMSRAHPSYSTNRKSRAIVEGTDGKNGLHVYDVDLSNVVFCLRAPSLLTLVQWGLKLSSRSHWVIEDVDVDGGLHLKVKQHCEGHIGFFEANLKLSHKVPSALLASLIQGVQHGTVSKENPLLEGLPVDWQASLLIPDGFVPPYAQLVPEDIAQQLKKVKVP